MQSDRHVFLVSRYFLWRDTSNGEQKETTHVGGPPIWAGGHESLEAKFPTTSRHLVLVLAMVTAPHSFQASSVGF